jgi:adenylate kinase family enzyme
MRDIVILGGPDGAGKTTAAPFVVSRELGILEFRQRRRDRQGALAIRRQRASPWRPAAS